MQALLRPDVKTTLQLYSHSVSEDRMLAQETVLQAILGSATDESDYLSGVPGFPRRCFTLPGEDGLTTSVEESYGEYPARIP